MFVSSKCCASSGKTCRPCANRSQLKWTIGLGRAFLLTVNQPVPCHFRVIVRRPEEQRVRPGVCRRMVDGILDDRCQRCLKSDQWKKFKLVWPSFETYSIALVELLHPPAYDRIWNLLGGRKPRRKGPAGPRGHASLWLPPKTAGERLSLNAGHTSNCQASRRPRSEEAGLRPP